MKVDVIESVRDDRADEAWRLYRAAFDELDRMTVQRHLMYKAEFDEVMVDRRIDKYLALDDDGSLLGLSTFTRHLDAMPLISPRYFARRWPAQYAQQRVWYCGFVAVDPPGSGAYAGLVEAMWLVGSAGGGVIALDFCEYNDTQRKMARSIRVGLHRLARKAGGRLDAERADTQQYWTYRLHAGGRP